jgi:hypothetical protein
MATITVTKGYNNPTGWISGEEVTPAKLNSAQTPTVSVGDIVNADISGSAAIAHSKLANITAGQVLLGNASAVPTATALTGDVTVSSTGVTSIAANAVVTADIADAAVIPAKLSQPLTLATAQNTTSGTSIDFSPASGNGIPSWAKRITVMFNGVSTSGSSNIQIQIGAGSFVNTGYAGTASTVVNATNSGVTAMSSGFLVSGDNAAAVVIEGAVTIVNISGNTWIASGVCGRSAASTASMNFSAGRLALSGALDRVRITTANGTDTFDAGSVNVMYEG